MADDLYFFGVTVADSAELQQLFSECRSIDEMMEIIEFEGLGLSLSQLHKYALRHDEPWWPWAGESEAWKHDFFAAARRQGGPGALLFLLLDGLVSLLDRAPQPVRRGIA